jgi:hypothetical protein
MTTPLSPSASPAQEVSPARAYRLAHEGRLMIIQREDGRELAIADFFRFDGVGTHPTGLIVTGIFQDRHRAHMMATGVREANAAEVAWLTAATEKLSPQ